MYALSPRGLVGLLLAGLVLAGLLVLAQPQKQPAASRPPAAQLSTR